MGREAANIAQRPIPLHFGRTEFGVGDWRQVAKGAVWADGVVVVPDILHRIKSIGIPPAYDFVWICPSANGHIQATGLDARRRKQYRYHPKWRVLRDQTKYEHIVEYVAALTNAYRQVLSPIYIRSLWPNGKKIAAAVRFMRHRTLLSLENSALRFYMCTCVARVGRVSRRTGRR